MRTAVYIVIGFVLSVTLNRAGLLRAENAMHVIIGLYAGVIGTAMMERKWPLALYYASAISISVAVLWMARENQHG